MVKTLNTREQSIKSALEMVADPEIPTISIVDLGIVTKIESPEEKVANIQLTPTFSGCPALRVMEQLVYDKLMEIGFETVKVVTSFETQWNTNMISDKGREALLKHGLAPPVKHDGYIELDVLSDTPCPLCGSRNTTMKSPFGPTLCRSLHYCNNCSNAFEGFKPVS